MSFEIINADCLKAMADMPDNSVDAIVTDPPYGVLKHKIETGVDIEGFMRESNRLLKPDGVLCFFGKMPSIADWHIEAVKYRPFKQEIIWDKVRRSSPAHTVGKQHENVYIYSTRPLNEVFLDLYFCIANEMKDMAGLERVTNELRTIFGKPEKLREYADFIENPVYDKENKGLEQSCFSHDTKICSRWIMSLNIVRKGYKASSE